MLVQKITYRSPRTTAIKPRVFLITYGAGGSTRERTLQPLMILMVKARLLHRTFLYWR
jgi:hypothetical protein